MQQYSIKNLLCGVLILFYLEAVMLQSISSVVLVHGGAGEIADASIPGKHYGAKLAARIGYETLRQTGSVLDAVQEAVRSMELDPNFNSGYGSVLTWNGTVEMDAALMDGRTLDAGCLSLARDIYHPIVLARSIMEKTRHKYLAGNGAMEFAVEQGFQLLPAGALVTAKSIKALEDYKNSLNATLNDWYEVPPVDQQLDVHDFGEPGTVGAVAIDANGNVAAATSTGGITGKLPGRIGDSSILGGGTYADNAAGTVSATGHGETIMRYTVASRILAQIASNMTAQQATEKVLNDMTLRFNQTGGVISIDRSGNLGIYFTSRRMSWAYQRGHELHYGINREEDVMEIIDEARNIL